jgi:hypothetical protein
MNFAVAIIGIIFNGSTLRIIFEALRLACLQRYFEKGWGPLTTVGGPASPVAKQSQPVPIVLPAALYDQG